MRASSKRRVYLLTGIVECSCGRRLHGQTRSARGREWRYYLCRSCDAPSVPVEDVDSAVLSRIRAMSLPACAIEAAREELRRRLSVPSRGASDDLRARLETRLSRLKSQFQWGDIDEAEYRGAMLETKAELALLPAPDKVVTFDQVASVVASLERAIDVASVDQLRQLIRLLVTRVSLRAGNIEEIEFVPSALPFFAPQPDLLMAPPDGLEPPTQALGRPRSVH